MRACETVIGVNVNLTSLTMLIPSRPHQSKSASSRVPAPEAAECKEQVSSNRSNRGSGAAKELSGGAGHSASIDPSL